MNTDSAREDLAFLKSLVAGDGGARAARVFGTTYFAAGLLYGFQAVVQWAQTVNLIVMNGPTTLIFLAGVSITFLAILAIVAWRNRGASSGGLNARAVNAAFAATGLSNLVLIVAIGLRAYVEQSLSIWLIYPIVVFVLQGAAWLMAFMLMRVWWHGLVAGGWYVTGLAMAATIGRSEFVVIVGVALLLFMALPGYLIMRSAKFT